MTVLPESFHDQSDDTRSRENAPENRPGNVRYPSHSRVGVENVKRQRSDDNSGHSQIDEVIFGLRFHGLENGERGRTLPAPSLSSGNDRTFGSLRNHTSHDARSKGHSQSSCRDVGAYAGLCLGYSAVERHCLPGRGRRLNHRSAARGEGNKLGCNLLQRLPGTGWHVPGATRQLEKFFGESPPPVVTAAIAATAAAAPAAAPA